MSDCGVLTGMGVVMERELCMDEELDKTDDGADEDDTLLLDSRVVAETLNEDEDIEDEIVDDVVAEDTDDETVS